MACRDLESAVCGGLLVGLAGATFALRTKPGRGRPQGAEGTGWIALALVIFGGGTRSRRRAAPACSRFCG
ncbi:MAG: hypothetical protein HY895_05415 [Deltaproteobacteria bacterium]|nr:hypothetical protein [Deltaproteobacteria bacterium]